MKRGLFAAEERHGRRVEGRLPGRHRRAPGAGPGDHRRHRHPGEGRRRRAAARQGRPARCSSPEPASPPALAERIACARSDRDGVQHRDRAERRDHRERRGEGQRRATRSSSRPTRRGPAPVSRSWCKQLLATGKPVVVVAVRDPYDIAYFTEAPTYLATYSTTAISMESLARVLFGEVQPGGQLPVDDPGRRRPRHDALPVRPRSVLHVMTLRRTP